MWFFVDPPRMSRIIWTAPYKKIHMTSQNILCGHFLILLLAKHFQIRTSLTWYLLFGKLSANFNTAPAASKNDTHLQSGQKWP